MEDQEEIIEVRQPKSFKDYYADPEFKKKHQAYCLETLECECGRTVSRVGMYRHKQSAIHEKCMRRKEQNDRNIDEIVERLLNERLEKLLKK